MKYKLITCLIFLVPVLILAEKFDPAANFKHYENLRVCEIIQEAADKFQRKMTCEKGDKEQMLLYVKLIDKYCYGIEENGTSTK